MKAFHNDPKIKEKYLARVREHAMLDHLIRGVGYENINGKIRACAIFCTVEIYDHSRYPIELGIPEWLAFVEDKLFESMSLEKSRTWPEVFLQAIEPGADLEKAKKPFLIMVLKHSLVSLDVVKFDAEKFPYVKAAVESSRVAVLEMIRCHENDSDMSAASYSARSAAEWARSAAKWYDDAAAERVAEAAAQAALSAAWSAERAAANSAFSTERAAEAAAMSAATSAANSARSARLPVRSAAELAAFDYYADELIKILRSI